jgi:hypothetical protein
MQAREVRQRFVKLMTGLKTEGVKDHEKFYV